MLHRKLAEEKALINKQTYSLTVTVLIGSYQALKPRKSNNFLSYDVLMLFFLVR